jgi:hypothetical protein
MSGGKGRLPTKDTGSKKCFEAGRTLKPITCGFGREKLACERSG